MSKKLTLFAALLFVAVLFVLGAAPAFAAAGYTLFGDASLVSPGYNSMTAAQIRSDATIPPYYGGVDFNVPAGMTVADLNNLSTDYQFTAGSCGGGSPRFQINVTTPSNGTQNIFVYIGPPPNYTLCPQNVWSNTGNLAAPANLVDTSQLGGTFYDPYANAQLNYGSYPVTGIQVVVDSYWAVGGVQTAQVDNVNINSTVYTFESKASCKKGGWKNFTSAPGPFKNQGDCVSFFASGH